MIILMAKDNNKKRMQDHKNITQQTLAIDTTKEQRPRRNGRHMKVKPKQQHKATYKLQLTNINEQRHNNKSYKTTLDITR